MDKVKIQEIADEAGLSNAELLDKAKELGFDVKAANSTISMEDAGILVDYAISGTLPKGFKKPGSKPKITVVKKKVEEKKVETPKVETPATEEKTGDTREDRAGHRRAVPGQTGGVLRGASLSLLQEREPREGLSISEALRRQGDTQPFNLGSHSFPQRGDKRAKQTA